MLQDILFLKSTYRSYVDTLVRNLINAVSVTKVFFINVILKNTWGHTLEINHTHTSIVERLSQKIVVLKNTWGHTLERNHIHASIVKRILHIEEILEFIWEYILVRSHISVSCAPCPLNIIALLYLINWDTVGRNHISAGNVTRHSLLKVYL